MIVVVDCTAQTKTQMGKILISKIPVRLNKLTLKNERGWVK